MAVSELVATATATAALLHPYVLKYRTTSATPLATVIKVAVAVYSYMPPIQEEDLHDTHFTITENQFQ